MLTGNSGNVLQAPVGTAPEAVSGEERGRRCGPCDESGMVRVPSYGHPTDHHLRLTSKLRGSSLRGGYQCPHFAGRETEAQRG